MQIVPVYLLSAMFLTLLILYLFSPDPEIVVKYPNPRSDISDVYVDENDVCYRYYRNQVTI